MTAPLFECAGAKYPHDTPHRREVVRALSLAVATWGPDRPWETLTRADWRALWRASLAASKVSGRARSGVRAAEIAVSRVATVARHLVEEGHVSRIVLPAKDWRAQVRADVTPSLGREPTVHRPRYTLAEMRALLAAAQDADPRFTLLLMLGAELRLGQVARCRRRDLNLTAPSLTVPGRRRKQGAVVVLTPGQVAAAQSALTGYLAPLEATGEDYPLFPAGQLPGGRSGQWRTDPARHLTAAPVGRRWVLAQFLACERRAGIPHVEGRATYGVRRAAVDAVKQFGISREGLQASGGWSDAQTPDRIYAEQQAEYARLEAARVRAAARGEGVPS